MATHYCSCRELDINTPSDFADIICDSCSLCGRSVHALSPVEKPDWTPPEGAFDFMAPLAGQAPTTEQAG